MERITRRDCEAQLRIVAKLLGRPVSESWPFPHGGLRLNDESGVKRVRITRADESGNGESDIGPGFLTWREAHTFLRGMVEALYLTRDTDA